MVKPVYETKDLYLVLTRPDLSHMIMDYYVRNKDFFAQFDPAREDDFYTEDYQKRIIEDDCRQIENNTGYRFWIVEKNDYVIIGMAAFNSIVWGPFKSSFLSYKLDKDYLNRGYMTQAVLKCKDIAFNDIGLHRIEANIMPRNKASLRVVEKAGFINEGLSKEYLNINGVWEDHIHMVAINH